MSAGRLVLAAALALAACRGPDGSAAGPIRLRVAMLPFYVYAPFLVARDLGYFAEQGLEVEFVRLPAGAPRLAALARGQVDVIGERASVALLESLAGGARLAAVADLWYVDSKGCVQGAILARPELARDRSAGALVGRKVEMDRAGVENYLLDRVLEPIGRTSADVEAVDLDDPVLGEAFATGAIDFAFTSEPWSSRLVESGRAVVWRSFQEIAPEFEVTYLIYGPELLDRRPEVGRRFLLAHLRAVDALAAGLTEVERRRLAGEFGLDLAQLGRLCPTPARRDGILDGRGLRDFQRWALARGYLDRDAPLESFFDRRFADAFAGGIARRPAGRR